MKAVMVMYDTLDKNFLGPYGCDWTHTPNFMRLAEKTVKFNNFYVGSMPCMPARRELHTGRYNFLHRGWGPLEPFDESMPELLKNNGVQTHIATDHYHYWQDGGGTYHTRYSTYEFVRGQEGDAWKGEVETPDLSVLHESLELKQKLQPKLLAQDLINRKYMTCDEEMPQSQTFAYGLEYIEKNHREDNWFLTIETFDPHEPFFTQEDYKKLYPHEYHGKQFDWPNYAMVTESDEDINHLRMEYAALISMCDDKLGLVLDAFDKYNLWEDTMLIVNTDHGFLLGEHEWWGKMAPLYNEIANIPFFIYDPRTKNQGECDALCQTIDIAPTLLDFFGVDIPKSMMGKTLNRAYDKNQKLREYALYGEHGCAQCITDGRYTYFRAPVNRKEMYDYTLMPTDMDKMYSVEDLKNIEITGPYSFTKGARVMKVNRKSLHNKPCAPFDLLFDLDTDPKQNNNLPDYQIRAKLSNEMISIMKDNEAPDDAYIRLGFSKKKKVNANDLIKQEEKRVAFYQKGIYKKYDMTDGAREYLHAILSLVPFAFQGIVSITAEKYFKELTKKVSINEVNAFLDTLEDGPMKDLSWGARMYAGFFAHLDK